MTLEEYTSFFVSQATTYKVKENDGGAEIAFLDWRDTFYAFVYMGDPNSMCLLHDVSVDATPTSKE